MSIILRLSSDLRGDCIVVVSAKYTLDSLQRQLDEAWEMGSPTTIQLREGNDFSIKPTDWQRMSIAHEWLMPDGRRRQ